jgi:uncharacterized protein (DUF2235 family)
MSATETSAAPAAAGRAPKSLIVFSDGTGNSSAKLFKTNVWRLYQAVDTKDPEDPTQRRQIVAYDDGVGTSSFKPLALLGGAFGVGLSRNVLELYRFICRNYAPGDRIYAFGFSRGAFTIRVLIGLLTTVGIIRFGSRSEARLDALSGDAYRRFRRLFVLSGNRPTGSAQKNAWLPMLTNVTVNPLRNLRDGWTRRWRGIFGPPMLTDHDTIPVEKDHIEFVGVWDTVAAYGSPVAEITKGIDRWVWPLSMPDFKLSEKVRCARHALALDDERDTFHPLLWDEIHERGLVASGQVAPDRLRQVWFAGMHSDVGGGYSDDSLAYVPLVWMANEAVARGLRLRAKELGEYRDKADPFGPIHDSRSGLAGYYRYQPRKIAARLEPRDRTTRVFQDPDVKYGLLEKAHIHESVFQRIARGTDGYAPIVLPGDYDVEGGGTPEPHAAVRAQAQERVWDAVWRRRVNYFLTIAFTLGLAAMGFLPPSESSCVGPQCVITPVLRTVGDFLPGFLARWIDAFADRPLTFLVLAAAIAWLMAHTRRTEQSIRDRMRALFRLSMSAPGPTPAALEHAEHERGFIRGPRSSRLYQASLQYLKWRALPAGAAVLLYMAIGAVVYGAVSLGHRVHLAFAAESICREHGESGGTFSTKSVCWRTGMNVEAGQRYRLRLRVTTPWTDGDGEYAATPEGFSTHEFPWWVRTPAALLRRSINDPWFTPIVHVESYRRGRASLLSVAVQESEREPDVYVGAFTAPADGELVLSVNDAVFLWLGDVNRFYVNNEGRAEVEIMKCPGESAPGCAL